MSFSLRQHQPGNPARLHWPVLLVLILLLWSPLRAVCDRASIDGAFITRSFITPSAISGITLDAVPDSSQPVILTIMNLNGDCWRDTIIGWWSGDDRTNLPRSIKWGWHTGTGEPNPACFGGIPPYKRVRETRIIYPSWSFLSGSAAIEHINHNDTLPDLVLYMWGRYGSQQRDSLRRLALFAQKGLDTLPMIDIGTIESYQAAPFFAMDMVIGATLVEPATRDLSGRTSYILQTIPLHMATGDTIAPSPSPMSTASVRVFPNPATSTATVEATPIPPGEYAVEIIAANGEVYSRQEVRMESEGTLSSLVDLHRLPSGFYAVRLHSGNRLVLTYPIIVTR